MLFSTQIHGEKVSYIIYGGECFLLLYIMQKQDSSGCVISTVLAFQTPPCSNNSQPAAPYTTNISKCALRTNYTGAQIYMCKAQCGRLVDNYRILNFKFRISSGGQNGQNR